MHRPENFLNLQIKWLPGCHHVRECCIGKQNSASEIDTNGSVARLRAPRARQVWVLNPHSNTQALQQQHSSVR